MDKLITTLQRHRDESTSGTSLYTRGYLHGLEFALTLLRLEQHKQQLIKMGFMQ